MSKDQSSGSEKQGAADLGKSAAMPKWRVISPLKLGGKVHEVDDVIALSADQAEQISEGVLERV